MATLQLSQKFSNFFFFLQKLENLERNLLFEVRSVTKMKHIENYIQKVMKTTVGIKNTAD